MLSISTLPEPAIHKESSEGVGMKHPRLSASWIALITFLIVAVSHNADAEQLILWPTKQWQRSTPEEQGMSSAALSKLVEFGATRSFDSLLIARHGRLVLDAYYTPYSADHLHELNSATKS